MVINNSMKKFVKKFPEVINESKFPHEIKSEKYWRQILGQNKCANEVLDTIMTKQHGMASDRQMAILRRVERGDTSPYPTKN